MTSKEESVLLDVFSYAGLKSQITKKDVTLGNGKMVYTGCEWADNTVFLGTNMENHILVFRGMKGLNLLQTGICHEAFDLDQMDFKITQCNFKFTVGALENASLEHFSKAAWELLQSCSKDSKTPISFENNKIQIGKRGSRFCLTIIPETDKRSLVHSVNKIGLDVRFSRNSASQLTRYLTMPENSIDNTCAYWLREKLRAFREANRVSTKNSRA